MLRIITGTPGFTATIYARKTAPPIRWPDPGWVAISASTKIGAKQEIHLSSTSTTFKYFLIWMTTLGSYKQLQLNEVTLYK